MAKGKSKGPGGLVSKGERRSSTKTDWIHTDADRILFKMDALRKGKDAYFTVANPNKNETNKRFIRVKVSGKGWLARQAGL